MKFLQLSAIALTILMTSMNTASARLDGSGLGDGTKFHYVFCEFPHDPSRNWTQPAYTASRITELVRQCQNIEGGLPVIIIKDI